MEQRSMGVPEGLDGVRVDAGLAKLLGFSRTMVVEIIDSGGIRVNGLRVGKSDRLNTGDWLEIEWAPVAELVAVATPVENFTIIYDDDDLVVVDKPAWVAAHPSRGWSGPTVSGALLAAGYRIATSGAQERQGIVQRLDVGTSGLMVVAKSEHAYSVLKGLFRDRKVEKIYHTLVQGHPDPSSGTIDAPLARHPSAEWKFAVVAGGRNAVTHYDTIEAFPYASLLKIHLETGRTHQIRVHMAAHRHPCVGDVLYGADPSLSERVGINRQWLHAKELSFAHPRTGLPVRFESEYPEDLRMALERVAGAS